MQKGRLSPLHRILYRFARAKSMWKCPSFFASPLYFIFLKRKMFLIMWKICSTFARIRHFFFSSAFTISRWYSSAILFWVLSFFTVSYLVFGAFSCFYSPIYAQSPYISSSFPCRSSSAGVLFIIYPLEKARKYGLSAAMNVFSAYFRKDS